MKQNFAPADLLQFLCGGMKVGPEESQGVEVFLLPPYSFCSHARLAALGLSAAGHCWRGSRAGSEDAEGLEHV